LKLLFSLFLFLITGCSTLPNSKQIKTEHGNFTYFLSGVKKPTVVLESGLGDDMTSWKPVINKLEEFSEVFTYNRAGFSGSNSENTIRNGKIIVKELKALLKSTNLNPPYILVGHSLGGAYMELYAKTYPDEVAGVVLVDPNSSKYPEHCKREKLDYCDPPSSMPKWATLFFPSAVEGEIIGFSSTHSQVNAIENFPNVPLAVISATHRNENQTDKEKISREFYVKMHKNLSELSPKSKFITCDSCSHYIHRDDPDLVVNTIKWVLDEAETHKNRAISY